MIGALVAGIAILVNATRDQASRIAKGVSDNGAKLDTLHTDMGTLHEAMGTLHEDMGTLQEGIGTLQEGMDTLIGGQAEQTAVLAEIRDRL